MSAKLVIEFNQWYESLNPKIRGSLGPVYAVWNGWVAGKSVTTTVRDLTDAEIVEVCNDLGILPTSEIRAISRLILAKVRAR